MTGCDKEPIRAKTSMVSNLSGHTAMTFNSSDSDDVFEDEHHFQSVSLETTKEEPRQAAKLSNQGVSELESSTSDLSSTSLITTMPGEEGDLEEAVHHQPHKSPLSKGKCLIIIAASAVVLVALTGVILLVVLLGFSTEDNNVERPNPVDVATPEGYLKGILGKSLVLPEGTHGDSQQQALEWLAQDPGLTTYPTDRVIQRYALAVLYFTTQGSLWRKTNNWMSYEHECDWYGTEKFMTSSTYPCNLKTFLFERLELRSNNLNGTIPEEIYALTSLESLDMAGNRNLLGTISSKIGQLTHLQEISFVKSNLWGTLATEMGLLTDLKILSLSRKGHENDPKKFHGTIPTELAKLTSLEEITLDLNRFSGTIPAQIGAMTNLVTIGFQGNFFKGAIPTQFGQLGRLKHLGLYWNQMDGTIPSELSLLQNIEILHLHFNSFQGTVPHQLGSNTNLKQLSLAENNLQGFVPSDLGRLTNLNLLYLSGNAGLTGPLPVEFENLEQVDAFDIGGTSIVTGSVPPSLLDAQKQMPFHRFYYECNQMLSCNV